MHPQLILANSPGHEGTLVLGTYQRIAILLRRTDSLAGSRSWQVFWLMVHPTPRAFPSEDVNREALGVKREDLFLRLTVHE